MRDALVDVAVEADGLALGTDAVHDAGLEPARDGLAHDGAHVAVEPRGAKLEHVDADGGIGGELALLDVNDLEGAGDLLRDGVTGVAPRRELARVLVAQPLRHEADVDHVDGGEKGVLLLDVLENLVEDGGGHHLVGHASEVGERLLGVGRPECVDYGVVIGGLLRCELAEPALREDCGVVGSDGRPVLLGNVIEDGCAIVGQRPLHLLRIVGREGGSEGVDGLLALVVEVDCH